MKNIITNKCVAVAMSGGVDSSVTAAILKEKGAKVFGVTMRFACRHPFSGKNFSWGDEGVVKAQRVAAILGIEHHTLDLSGAMDEYVIRYFTSEYMNARTPNPCVMCNRKVKFDALWAEAKKLGAEFLATGHYARIENISGEWRIKKAVDPKKDQSYFLWAIDKNVLPFILFPLADLTKPEVRILSEKYGLPSHQQKESQDICFVPDGYKKFLDEQIDTSIFKPGNFIDQNGKVVGQHQGILNYTVGQRENLGIALGHRVYISKIDKEKNEIHLVLKDQVYSNELVADQVNVLSDKLRDLKTVQAQARYGAPICGAAVTWINNAQVKVIFDAPQFAITPGQSVVFYDQDVLLGGGIIV
ncbi:MAG: tRNA 2-thiouridine(34) synthase MnmA [Candidatus Omnitrophica bacterium]|nr:tRNA 2-thiouridine(34) synthase MnmA [Candidatus Omnitrophota bacterium]